MLPVDAKLLEQYVQNKNLSALEKLITTQTKQKSRKQHIVSYLMLSAHNIKHLQKIDALECGAVMLNLEDGVSNELKPYALRLAQLSIQCAKADTYIVVRVNALDEGGIEEIKALNSVKPDAIRVPKIYGVDDVKRVLELVDNDIEIHLSIETKEAFGQIQSLKIDKRITVFYLGILDLYADLQIPQSSVSLSNPFTHYIVSKFLFDCKCADVKPVGFTYQNHTDLEGFKQWCELEQTMGFEAKSCISPKQVAIANRVFSGEGELLRAKEIIKLFEAKKKSGITGFDTKEYGFIDEPIYKDALNIVAKYP
jgi:citrate lyase subunit beta/citryl-CoA lyase